MESKMKLTIAIQRLNDLVISDQTHLPHIRGIVVSANDAKDCKSSSRKLQLLQQVRNAVDKVAASGKRSLDSVDCRVDEAVAVACDHDVVGGAVDGDSNVGLRRTLDDLPSFVL